jgi:hypothetical protein
VVNVCNAFSCIVLKSRKVIWKLGMDSHDNLLKSAGIADDTKDPKEIKFCRIEISPETNDYLNPDAKYKFKIDTDIVPVWWEERHEKAAWLAFQKWKKQLDKILVRKPIVHPFKIIPPEITDEHIRLLKELDSVGASVWASVRASVRASVWDSVWASVRASVGASVGDSVGASVRDSVGASVWASVRASVRASVWDSVWASVRDSVGASVRDSVGASVWAYTGSFFILPRDAWKYTENIKTEGYPFQCLVTLWEQGLVTSFDGKKWRLHGGKDAKILWEGEL